MLRSAAGLRGGKVKHSSLHDGDAPSFLFLTGPETHGVVGATRQYFLGRPVRLLIPKVPDLYPKLPVGKV